MYNLRRHSFSKRWHFMVVCFARFDCGVLERTVQTMQWIKVEDEAHYPAFRCSKCGAMIVVEDECLELPCYCKNCEEGAEDD